MTGSPLGTTHQFFAVDQKVEATVLLEAEKRPAMRAAASVGRPGLDGHTESADQFGRRLMDPFVKGIRIDTL